jgi:hypothetical protein
LAASEPAILREAGFGVGRGRIVDVSGKRPGSSPATAWLILILAVDVSDIAVLLIAILDEGRTVELLIVVFVIIFPLG